MSFPLKAHQSRAQKNVLQVTVEELEFLGSFWRAWLSSNKLGSDGLKANFSINAARRLGLTEGKKVKIALPPERVQVFNARS